MDYKYYIGKALDAENDNAKNMYSKTFLFIDVN